MPRWLAPAPRQMLPPPTTTATCTPSAWISLMDSATFEHDLRRNVVEAAGLAQRLAADFEDDALVTVWPVGSWKGNGCQ